jgi:hypothetical protein
VRKSTSLIGVPSNLSRLGIFSDLLATGGGGGGRGGGGGGGGSGRGGSGPPCSLSGGGPPSGPVGPGTCCNKASWTRRVVTAPSDTAILSYSSLMCWLVSLRA